MKKVVYTLKLGFTGITFSALVEKGRNCVAMLTGNAAFATPVPALAAITAACDRLALANERYGFTRSRLDLAERQTAFAELKALLKELGGYVQAVSEGDKDLILSAGFEVEKQRTPVGELPAPQDLRALVTMYPGILELLWKAAQWLLLPGSRHRSSRRHGPAQTQVITASPASPQLNLTRGFLRELPWPLVWT